MAQPGEDPSTNDSSTIRSSSFTLESDAAFQATPIGAQNSAKDEDISQKADPSFIQNQISIQRSPSNTKEQVNALSRQLSAKSNGTYDSNRAAVIPRLDSNLVEEPARGRERGDSDSSIVEATSNCTLSKSSSERSTKSVRSLHALGSYPLGSLRVHSPSPTRKSGGSDHECLKSGDVVVIREVPAGSLIGYDTKAFVIKKDDDFEGIREIPAGAHFIWGGSGSASLRTGFWIMSAKRASDEYGEIHVRRWDSYAEVIEEYVIPRRALIC